MMGKEFLKGVGEIEYFSVFFFCLLIFNLRFLRVSFNRRLEGKGSCYIVGVG